MNATLSDLLDAYARLCAAGEDAVVATIVATEGSTYRKAGARMLFTRDGGWIGMLGGGSFEQELAELAAPLFAGGGPRDVECDMPSRRDASAGTAWERDGSARIFLQRAGPENGYAPLSLLARMVSERHAGVLATVCRSADARVAAGMCFTPGGDGATGSLPPELADEAAATAASAATDGEPILVEHLLPEGEVEIFYAPVKPPLALLVLGAGPDAMPLARIAGLLGWNVTMVDPRGGDRTAGDLEVVRCDSGDLAGRVPLDRTDAAVLMLRNFELDRQYLPVLARSAVPYIGVLGSKRRRQRLLEGMDAALAAALEGRLHGPAGMDLGADSPEEIALEIAAEVQSLHARRGREAREKAAAREAALKGVHAVVLAAGGSRRYGGFKQLLEFQGESLLRRATRAASSLLGDRVVVVHGPKPTKCQRELASFNVRHIVNERWESGIAGSLRAGVRSLPEDCAAVLVLLCDQPLVGEAQIGQLLNAWLAHPDRIAAAAYAGTLGVPALFPREFFPALLELQGDRGAKSVIDARRAEVIAVPLREAELDIDTQDDYAAILTGRASGTDPEPFSREPS